MDKSKKQILAFILLKVFHNIHHKMNVCSFVFDFS